ncbi:uncharacterized protein LOC119653139 [Hermetia illucens]|uniref:uncharacterized protein LOC119653139 n=1 Tax=Hermetia illucens TaxID=343691 RepID=UPI0018CC078E|nr:uncharacterized protein LOC119653139 [Hermetia illucens]
MNNHNLYQAFLLAASVLMVVSDSRNSLRLTRIDCRVCECGKADIKNLTCRIKAMSRSRTAIFAEAFLMRPFDDVLVHMQIFKRNSVRYLPFMVNVTFFPCKYFEGSDNTFYAKFMINWINKYSNINHSCPYSDRIFADNLEPFAEKIPVFAPAGDYRLDLHFYQSNLKTLLASINGYGTITIRPFMQGI